MDLEFDRVRRTDRIIRPLPYDPTVAASYEYIETAVRVDAADGSTVRSLKELCAEAIAMLIDRVESLDGIPWHVASNIYKKIEIPTPAVVSLFTRDFPEEFGSCNKHLVFRDYKIPATIGDQLRDGWLGSFLKILDLSGTDFNDELCSPISRMQVLELLDVSSTQITNDGLRILSRPIVHSEKDSITGLPTVGLMNLTSLNLSACPNLASASMDEILSRFPSLLIVGLNRIFVQVKTAAAKMKQCGWTELSQRVNAFPGIRGDLDNFVIEADTKCMAYDDVSALVAEVGTAENGIKSVHSTKFFGTLSKASKINLKQQMESYFKCCSFKLDQEISDSAYASLPDDLKPVIECAWSLLRRQHFDLPEKIENLDPCNDLYQAVIGTSRLEMHNKMRHWYFPSKGKRQDLENDSSHAALINDMVQAEIHGRFVLIRTEARRDFELKKVANAAMISKCKEILPTQTTTTSLSKRKAMQKQCSNRLEPKPAIVPLKSAKKPFFENMQEFGSIKDLDKTFIPLTSVAAAASSNTASSGKSKLFRLLNKNVM